MSISAADIPDALFSKKVQIPIAQRNPNSTVSNAANKSRHTLRKRRELPEAKYNDILPVTALEAEPAVRYMTGAAVRAISMAAVNNLNIPVGNLRYHMLCIYLINIPVRSFLDFSINL